MNVLPRAFVVMALLVSTARAEQPATSAVESAKKDLRDLPALERNTSGASLKSPKLEIPSLTPNLVPAAPRQSDTVPAATGPTWLLDGLKRTDAENAARRSSPPGVSEQSTRAADPGRTTTDPFAAYLTQWLTPRDLAILRPEVAAHNAAKSTKDPFEFEPTALPQGEPGAILNDANFREVAPIGFAPNPYLENLPAPPQAKTFTPQNQPHVPVNDRPGALPTATPTTGSTSPGSTMTRPAPAPATAVPAPPPTAPIVNDQKYFPQLRRF